MEPRQVKFKPFHGVLIVLMLALTAAIFLFKDKILPDLNAPYRAEYGRYIETPAVVISQGVKRGRRGSRTVVTVQFRDRGDVLRTADIEDNALQFASPGDTITIWYNPDDPKQADSERLHREIMGH